MARRKIRRKDLRQPDEFIELTGRVWRWLGENRVAAGVVVTVALTVVVGVSGVRYYLNRRSTQAATEFGKALTLYSSGDAAGALKAFSDMPGVGAYPSLADLYRGHAALKSEDFDAAAEAFRAAAGHANLPAYLRQEAYYRLADSLAVLEDKEGALEAYEAAAEIAGPFQGQACLAAARQAEALGDVAKARTLYQRVVLDAEGAETFDEDLRALAEWRLARLSEPAQAPD